ncbi:hypothetical protein ABIC83_002728 [Roseateles asaccharophilus]|uniref:hypothetical protein n=1 Tax=Roseateles asaccharophilus TaxID=582607 RepID=UPI0038394870
MSSRPSIQPSRPVAQPIEFLGEMPKPAAPKKPRVAAEKAQVLPSDYPSLSGRDLAFLGSLTESTTWKDVEHSMFKLDLGTGTNPHGVFYALKHEQAIAFLERIQELGANPKAAIYFPRLQCKQMEMVGSFALTVAQRDPRQALEHILRFSKDGVASTHDLEAARLKTLRHLLPRISKLPDYPELLTKLVDAIPRSMLLLHPTWRAKPGAKFTLTREIANTALDSIGAALAVPDISVARRSRLLDVADTLKGQCDLDWLSQEDVDRQLQRGMDWDRMVAFEGATDSQAQWMLRQVSAQDDLSNADHEAFVAKVSRIPNFKDLVTRKEIIECLFQPFTMTRHSAPPAHGSLSRFWPPHRLLRLVADLQPTASEGTALLNRAIDDMAAWVSDNGRYLGCNFAATCADLSQRMDILDPKASWKRSASAKHVLSVVREMDWERVGILHQPEADLAVRGIERVVASNPASLEAVRAVRVALIEAGAIHLSYLQKKDLTVKLVGPALRKEPGRLAEITDLAIFERLARIMNIPVRIPTTKPAESPAASTDVTAEQIVAMEKRINDSNTAHVLLHKGRSDSPLHLQQVSRIARKVEPVEIVVIESAEHLQEVMEAAISGKTKTMKGELPGTGAGGNPGPAGAQEGAVVEAGRTTRPRPR